MKITQVGKLLLALVLVAVIAVCAYRAPSTVLAASDIDASKPVSQETLDSLNPLNIANSTAKDDFKTPGSTISRASTYAFPAAGMILFGMLSWGGFEMLLGAVNKKSLDSGKQRITAAIVGFLLLFATYWAAQLLEAIFGVKIL